MKRNEIQIRDPFILTDPENKVYYLYGTTDSDPWNSRGDGFLMYSSSDLENWSESIKVFSPPSGFWGTHDFWAPEVHKYNDRYYMLATFTAKGRSRGTQILSAETPEGPFIPLINKAVTPEEWECLDGTLYIDESENPWIVFSHEWIQVNDGEIWAWRLSKNLKSLEGNGILLFKASSAGWPKCLPRRDGSEIVDARVTDGPFLFRGKKNELFLLWSSLSDSGYAMGILRSESGQIECPWIHQPEPLTCLDGGHGMVFTGFDNKLYLSYHSPNKTPDERFHYAEIHQNGNIIEFKGKK